MNPRQNLELPQINSVGKSKLKIPNEHMAIQKDIIPEKPGSSLDIPSLGGVVMLGEFLRVMCKNPFHVILLNKQMQIFSWSLACKWHSSPGHVIPYTQVWTCPWWEVLLLFQAENLICLCARNRCVPQWWPQVYKISILSYNAMGNGLSYYSLHKASPIRN